MDDRRIERIENKIDDLIEAQSEMNATLAAQHESLKLHMKRSDLLEEAMEPIKHKQAMLDGAIKLIIIVAGVAEVLHWLLK